MITRAAQTLCAALILVSSVAHAGGISIERVGFDELPGWDNDNHAEALAVFLKSCDNPRSNDLINLEDWLQICEIAKTGPDAKLFFETLFQPVLIEDGKKALFTGYYEPEIEASHQRTGKFL